MGENRSALAGIWTGGSGSCRLVLYWGY